MGVSSRCQSTNAKAALRPKNPGVNNLDRTRPNQSKFLSRDPRVRLCPTAGSVLKGPCCPPGILGMRSNTPCKIVRYTDKCRRRQHRSRPSQEPAFDNAHLSASRRILIYLGENTGGCTKHTIQETKRAFSERSRQPSEQILSVFLVVIMEYQYKILALQKHYIYIYLYTGRYPIAL